MNLADLASLADDAFARVLGTGDRAIRLRFPDRLGRVFDGVLMAQKVDVAEGIGEGLTAHVTCLTTRAELPLLALIGLPIEVQLVTDSGALKRFCAVVAEVRQGQSDGGLTVLQLTARDVLALMEGRRSNRVFLDKSLPDVVRTVLDGWRRRFPALAKCFDYRLLDLQESRYPKRAFLLQAHQSDAAFLRSVLARDGVNWLICPGPDGPDGTPAHCLAFFDDARSLPENAAGAVRYHRRDGTEPRDTMSLLAPAHRLVGGGIRLASWDHESGRVDVADDRGGIDQGEAGNQWASALHQSRIVLPHAGDDADDLERLVRVEHERGTGQAAVLLGIGGVRAQCVGEYNRIDGHPALDARPEHREYLVLRLEHWAINNLPKELGERAEALVRSSAGVVDGWTTTSLPEPAGAAAFGEGQRYVNRFVAVRRDVPIRPPWRPADDLPAMHLMTATVVGAGERPVWTDGLMRVKLRFHGLDPEEHDHAAGAGVNGNAGDSAWVRVHVPWAGDGYGMLFVPREGMEVSVAFEHGDPSRPVVVACRYNARQVPARFDHLGQLPENHALSGIVTRELGGLGQQQLRFNDTEGQISAQLASDHAASQLNLGSLATPMSAGRADARGEGAELRSDAAAVLRGGQGVLISSHAQPGAQGRQLARDELLGLTQALEGVAGQMAALAATHGAGAGANEAERLSALSARLRDWEKGSTTDPRGAGGGAPVVAVSAAAGAAVASHDGLLLGAQTTLDAVSLNDLHATAGQKLLLRSGELMAAFTQAAMKLIARLDVSIESHTGDVRIAAARVIDLVAGQKVRIQAPEVEIVSQGAATRWGSGSIVEQAKGPFVVKAASFAQSSGGDGVPASVAFPARDLAYDQQVLLKDLMTDEPLPGRRYVVKTASGAEFRGVTNAQGLTERFALNEPFEAYTLEMPPDAAA